MANQKVSDLAAVTTFASTDIAYIVVSGVSKKVTSANLINILTSVVGIGVEGDNNNKAYAIMPTDATHSKFAFGVGEGTFSGVKDPSLFWGYNLSRNGSNQIDTAKWSFTISMEADYYVNAGLGLQHTCEYNWGFQSAGLAYTHRPYQLALFAEPASDGSDAWVNHTIHIGPAGGAVGNFSYWQIQNDAVAPIFNITSGGELQLHHSQGEGLHITPQDSVGREMISFGVATARSNPFMYFANPVAVVDGTVDVNYSITAFNIKLTADSPAISIPIGGVVQGEGTAGNGFKLKNLKNSANTTASGTAKTVEIDIGGTPYYFLVYPTSSA